MQVVAGCVWVPQEKIWESEVFVVREGIHFTVDNQVRLMEQTDHANVLAAELGTKMYQRCHIQEQGGGVYPNHTPHTTARWGGLQCGGALLLAAIEPQVNQNLGDRVTDGGRSRITLQMLGLVWSPLPQEATSPTTTLTPLKIDTPRYTPATNATTPTTTPMLRQHRHQQRRNEQTHTTTAEGNPKQTRAAQKRHPGHRGPWVMRQQTLEKGGGGGCGLPHRSNCGELALAPNPSSDGGR